MTHPNNPILSVKGFSKSFGSFQAVNNLSFEVYPGEIFGFLGRNGAGKTTTIRTLLGIYQADEGELSVFSQKFEENLKSRIGYLPEERGLYTRSSVWDLLVYFARLKGLSRTEAKIRCEEYLKKFALWEHKGKKIQNLSSGMQQKVQIIQAIIHNPELLVLDEPFRGLDPVNRQMVFDVLKEIQAQGRTILFSSHQIAEIEDFCDRVIMIAQGENRAYGKVMEIKSRYENRFLHLQFQGDLPDIPHTEWVKNQGNQAEIKFTEEITPTEILKILVQHVEIERFSLDRPSLNEIFLDLCGDEVPQSEEETHA